MVPLCMLWQREERAFSTGKKAGCQLKRTLRFYSFYTHGDLLLHQPPLRVMGEASAQ